MLALVQSCGTLLLHFCFPAVHPPVALVAVPPVLTFPPVEGALVAVPPVLTAPPVARVPPETVAPPTALLPPEACETPPLPVPLTFAEEPVPDPGVPPDNSAAVEAPPAPGETVPVLAPPASAAPLPVLEPPAPSALEAPPLADELALPDEVAALPLLLDPTFPPVAPAPDFRLELPEALVSPAPPPARPAAPPVWINPSGLVSMRRLHDGRITRSGTIVLTKCVRGMDRRLPQAYAKSGTKVSGGNGTR